MGRPDRKDIASHTIDIWSLACTSYIVPKKAIPWMRDNGSIARPERAMANERFGGY